MSANIGTARLAPVGMGSIDGLVMTDAFVGSARWVGLSVLNAGGAHSGWTFEWLRNEGAEDIYAIRNDDMGLYLTMSDGDAINSRIWGRVKSTDPHLAPTQEWRFKPHGANLVQIVSRNEFAMQPLNGRLTLGTELALEPVNWDGGDQTWKF